MKLIDKIDETANQKLFLVGNQGQRIVFGLRYLPTQLSWVADIDNGKGFVVNGVALVASPNFLIAFKNVAKFGICCLTSDGLDPYYVDDFVSGRAALYLLSEDELLINPAPYVR